MNLLDAYEIGYSHGLHRMTKARTTVKLWDDGPLKSMYLNGFSEGQRYSDTMKMLRETVGSKEKPDLPPVLTWEHQAK